MTLHKQRRAFRQQLLLTRLTLMLQSLPHCTKALYLCDRHARGTKRIDNMIKAMVTMMTVQRLSNILICFQATSAITACSTTAVEPYKVPCTSAALTSSIKLIVHCTAHTFYCQLGTANRSHMQDFMHFAPLYMISGAVTGALVFLKNALSQPEEAVLGAFPAVTTPGCGKFGLLPVKKV